MKSIISDYRKAVGSIPLRWWTVTAIEFTVYLFTGVFSRGGISRVLSIVCTAFFVLMSAYVTLNVLLIVPRHFQKRLNALPDSERTAALEQYEKSPAIGKRHFLEKYLICFIGTDIVFLKFSEIKSAELKSFKLLLNVGKKKPLKMPFDANENPAMLVAAMRSRNPDISVILNGKVVEKTESSK